MARRASWAKAGEESTNYTKSPQITRIYTDDTDSEANRVKETQEEAPPPSAPSSSRLAVAGTATPCSPYAPIVDAPGGRCFRRGHRRHPIAGLEGNPVAVPATAKRSAKRYAKDRLVLLPFLLHRSYASVSSLCGICVHTVQSVDSSMMFAHDRLLAIAVQFAICNLQFAIIALVRWKAVLHGSRMPLGVAGLGGGLGPV